MSDDLVKALNVDIRSEAHLAIFLEHAIKSSTAHVSEYVVLTNFDATHKRHVAPLFLNCNVMLWCCVVYVPLTIGGLAILFPLSFCVCVCVCVLHRDSWLSEAGVCGAMGSLSSCSALNGLEHKYNARNKPRGLNSLHALKAMHMVFMCV